MTDLPADVIDEAERLTRRARRAVDDNEAEAYSRRRDDILEAHEYTARVREDDRAVLVLYPSEWVDEFGTVDPTGIDDVDRGIERPLEGPGEADDWDAVEDHNRELAAAVADAYGEPHGATAHALADFAGNHYAKSIEELTGPELAEFREEYFPRNAWPTDEQNAALSLSLEYVFEKADAERPD